MLCFGSITDDLLIVHRVNKLPFRERFSAYGFHAAKPQSTKPCNHVMSNFGGGWRLGSKKKKEKRKKGKMEWDFEYNTKTHTLGFAIDPHVICFVEQGVDTGFTKEFLASAVESGLTAVVSIFREPVACECCSVCVSVHTAEI